MGVGQGGLIYELKVFNAICNANIPKLQVGDKPTAGFSNQGAGDLEMTYDGRPFNVEIKMSANDQMGGTSLQYEYGSEEFKFVETGGFSDQEISMIQESLLSSKKNKALDKYLETLWKQPPEEYHKNITKIPFKAAKTAREELRRQQLLRAANAKIRVDSQTVIKHYNKKDVYYIQIGGAGFFYLGDNIFDFPIPELSGQVDLEVRLVYGGGKAKLPDDTDARIASYRIQGRLKSKEKSPYTLDCVDSICRMFGTKK